MKTELFIARKILFSKDGEKNVSPPAIRVAIVSIALGLIIIILAVSIVVGFKEEVAGKVIGFGSHIQISNIKNTNSYETEPTAFTAGFIDSVAHFPNIAHVQPFATMPGIIKTDDEVHAVILKGVDENYDWDFFQSNLIDGDVLNIVPDSTTTQVLISKVIADKLNFAAGDSFVTYFIQEPIRARKFSIAGIYQTNFSDYDKLFVFADIKQIRRLNGWTKNESSGLELLVSDYDKLDQTAYDMYFELAGRTDSNGNPFYVRSIKELNPMIFHWLDVLNINVVVILVLMLIVAGFSMISGLLIIIIERANMIGVLKSLGENNASIRKLFLIVSVFLIGRGLLWGNIIAFALCFIQSRFGIIKLDPVDYYLSAVPVHYNLWYVLLINLGTLLVTFLMLIGPSYIIAKISPAKTIRFE